jgi:hypothetical protein
MFIVLAVSPPLMLMSAIGFRHFGQQPSADIALGAKYFEHSSHQGMGLL